MMYAAATRMSLAIAMVGGCSDHRLRAGTDRWDCLPGERDVRPETIFATPPQPCWGSHPDTDNDGDTQLAAQWHTNDVLGNRGLDGDIGSDGSTPKDRAAAAGFRGQVAGTVATNPAVAIN